MGDGCSIHYVIPSGVHVTGSWLMRICQLVILVSTSLINMCFREVYFVQLHSPMALRLSNFSKIKHMELPVIIGVPLVSNKYVIKLTFEVFELQTYSKFFSIHVKTVTL